MTATLLQTKLYRPTPRPDGVSRERLCQQFHTGLWTGQAFARKLTLVSAPAGFGKTTLIVELGFSVLDAPEPQFTIENLTSAWLALDDADNDPVRFLRYVIAALQSALPEVGREAAPLLESSAAPALEEALASLINELAAAGCPIILTLDDYHVIHNAGITTLLTFLLEHQPPNLHLIIASRSDPALPLARLRARGQLLELRARDLRFTEAEAAAFFTQTMGLELRPEWVAALEQRTEGWIAGLQLAALSMQGRADNQAFIENFTGGQHFVLEYLVEEVLQRQPAALQQFLLETSILQRLCAPLCDAVTAAAESSATLAELQRRNLFIIPLDGAHTWFRYHHLFAEFLKSHLKRARADMLPVLHRRAAEWCQAHDYPEEALHHAFAIPDYRYVSRLVVDNWRRIYHTGRLDTAVRWLEALPGDLLRQSPPLGVAYGWTLFIRGNYDQIAAYLDDITQAFDHMVASGELPVEHPEYNIILQQVILLRAIVLRHQGDVAGAIREVEHLLPTIAELQHTLGQTIADMGYTACYSQMGYNYAAANDLARADAYLSRVGPHARACGNIFSLAHATLEWTRINLALGRVERAEEICRRELMLAEQPAYANYPAFCLIQLALADVLRVKQAWDEAESLLHQGLETARRSGHEYYLAQGYLIAARLQHAQGKSTPAQEAVRQAEQIAAAIHNRFLDEAIAQARQTLESQAAPAQPLIEPLTERELDVLRLICAGRSNQEIADALFIALDTVKRHANNIYGKLSVKRRAQAILEARRLGLV
ncbi:MAG: LuxR C-terminal-related transcriptional regulator [Anaerolineae bacterium]|jgi:LuxR family maltose regulon positive regulatory protein|nr:LuxR C-terminal-related transcriptional regulator [Anaerolineae bacterium]